METRSQIASKMMETRVEELEEKKIRVVQTELQKVMSRLDKLDPVDFEKLN